MENKDKPVYPIHWTDHEGNARIDSGLTKREYFAGLALQGILAGMNSSLEGFEMMQRGASQENISIAKNVTTLSLTYADQLLKQLGE